MILDKITQATRQRIEQNKRLLPLAELVAQVQTMPTTKSFPFFEALAKPGMSFICEVKKASPSKGILAEEFPYVEIAKQYAQAGADAISVLTEPDFFLGNLSYLSEIRKNVSTPLLRKDFTIDEYMIYEAKLAGADAILLICSILSQEQLKEYLHLADELGLSALVEAHTSEEIQMACQAGSQIIGVNNRNLQTFQVDLANSLRLRPMVPPSTLFVSESGISTRDDILLLEGNHVNAVLIGETFMKSTHKETMLKTLRGTLLRKAVTMKIKLCGVMREEDIHIMNRFRPDYVGFLFAESRRQISPSTARVFRNLLDPSIPSVGVFVKEDPSLIASLVSEGTISMIQLHGDEDDVYLASLRRLTDAPIIQVRRISPETSFPLTIAKEADFVLLDTFHKQLYGGSGTSFDWHLLTHPSITRPYFLAGGISMDNIDKALLTSAYCLDISSGAETDGQKDPTKIESLIRRIRV